LPDADVLVYDMYRVRAVVCNEGYTIALGEKEPVRTYLDVYSVKTVTVDPFTLRVSGEVLRSVK
jgi:hypothetical protein